MNTIVITTTLPLWRAAQETGAYTQSTVDSTLEEVGFIHATFPDQTMAMIKRKQINIPGLMLLLVDTTKLTSPRKIEQSLSGSGVAYPHIYGPINLDAVSEIIPIAQDNDGNYIEPPQLSAARLQHAGDH